MILKEVIKDPFEDSGSVIGPVGMCVEASVRTHTHTHAECAPAYR